MLHNPPSFENTSCIKRVLWNSAVVGDEYKSDIVGWVRQLSHPLQGLIQNYCQFHGECLQYQGQYFVKGHIITISLSCNGWWWWNR